MNSSSQFTAGFQGDPQKLQEVQSRIDAAQSYDPSGGTQSGIASAASGNQPNDSEMQAIFVTVAVAAAVQLGASAAAASAELIPIAAVVWGGGYALGQLVQNFFGITNSSPEACSDQDPNKGGQAPGDPGWVRYSDYYPHWQPFTQGGFENYARGVMIRTSELVANCKSIPGVQNIGQFASSLVDTWNKAAPPGTPMRTITWYLDINSTSPAYEGDPIQQLIRYMFSTYDDLGRADGVQGHPWSIQVADIPPPKSTSAAGSIAKHTAVIAAGGAVGGLIYAYATGKAIDAVFENAWRMFSGWFASAVGSVEKAAGVAKEKVKRRR